MDDNQNNRINPASNPFNQGDVNITEQYDEYGNRVVAESVTARSPAATAAVTSNEIASSVASSDLSRNDNISAEERVAEVMEEELGITPQAEDGGQNTENIKQKTEETEESSVLSNIPNTPNLPNPPEPVTLENAEEEAGATRDDVEANSPTHSIFDTLPSGQSPLGRRPDGVVQPKVGRSSAFPYKKTAALAIAAIVFTSASLFFYFQHSGTNQAQKVLGNAVDSSNLSKKVAALVELPILEQPSNRIVTDVQKLSDNPFFEKARNGDVALLYPKNKIAVLYRPSTGKVVAIGPLNLSKQVAGASTGSTSSPQTEPAASSPSLAPSASLSATPTPE